ncbi:hypothetical protein [Nocardioides currus]|uniref:hypothetical protein n=1 Tax=Nocardioides currus TaxID=2133958 RepID=UPI001057542A|nr:hypothetical protein [Nocardioides currus]
MTAVVVALIALLGVSLPYVATSQRRRLLKLITEEAEAIRAVKETGNDYALEKLTQSLSDSAFDYRTLTEPKTPLQAAAHRLSRWGSYLVAGSFLGLLASVLLDGKANSDGGAWQVIREVSLALSYACSGAVGLLIADAIRQGYKAGLLRRPRSESDTPTAESH